MKKPLWVRPDVVIAIHCRQLAEHGGEEGLRDEGLLDAALSKPQNLYHYSKPKPKLAALASSYAYGLAKAHPFIDGNKRTALVVCRLFLKLNGADLIASQEEKYLAFIKLASGKMSEKKLSDWITAHMEG